MPLQPHKTKIKRKQCIDCGKIFVERPSSRGRCPACLKKLRQEYRKRPEQFKKRQLYRQRPQVKQSQKIHEKKSRKKREFNKNRRITCSVCNHKKAFGDFANRLKMKSSICKDCEKKARQKQIEELKENPVPGLVDLGSMTAKLVLLSRRRHTKKVKG